MSRPLNAELGISWVKEIRIKRKGSERHFWLEISFFDLEGNENFSIAAWGEDTTAAPKLTVIGEVE